MQTPTTAPLDATGPAPPPPTQPSDVPDPDAPAPIEEPPDPIPVPPAEEPPPPERLERRGRIRTFFRPGNMIWTAHSTVQHL
jgi:hypothetical protein